MTKREAYLAALEAWTKARAAHLSAMCLESDDPQRLMVCGDLYKVQEATERAFRAAGRALDQASRAARITKAQRHRDMAAARERAETLRTL